MISHPILSLALTAVGLIILAEFVNWLGWRP